MRSCKMRKAREWEREREKKKLGVFTLLLSDMVFLWACVCLEERDCVQFKEMGPKPNEMNRTWVKTWK